MISIKSIQRTSDRKETSICNKMMPKRSKKRLPAPFDYHKIIESIGFIMYLLMQGALGWAGDQARALWVGEGSRRGQGGALRGLLAQNH